MKTKITVIGITAGGANSLPSITADRIHQCDLLVGGKRHLGYFPEYSEEQFAIGNNIPEVIDRLQRANDDDQHAIVLASGDPMCYGIGTTLRRAFTADQLEIIPAPSAFQLAFAAIAEPWEGAALLSAHGRPLDSIIWRIITTEKAAILTDSINTPQIIAQELLKRNMEPSAPCTICENLGSDRQRIVPMPLRDVATYPDFAPLNVFVIQNASPLRAVPPGLPDEAFATERGQITKREVRLLALAELGLHDEDVMWDVGAGSGSVSIEAARSNPSAQVYAIEKRDPFCRHIAHNISHLNAHNVHLIQGTAPGALTPLPDPDVVFIGGSGEHMTEIVKYVVERLRDGGRLVLNVVTLESLAAVRQTLPTAKVNQVNIQRGVPIADALRFEALNPVFIITWQKNKQ